MKRHRRKLIVAVACLGVAGMIATVAIGGSSESPRGGSASGAPHAGTQDAEASQTSAGAMSRQRQQRNGRHRHHWQNPAAGPQPEIEGGTMLPRGSGFLPSTIEWPVTGGWEAASHAKTTDIYAGADGEDRSTGLFAIMRTNVIHATQTFDYVRVAGSGPLKITKAPLGRKVAVWAQERGEFEFTSRNGIEGTLHLQDDTVTLTP